MVIRRTEKCIRPQGYTSTLQDVKAGDITDEYGHKITR